MLPDNIPPLRERKDDIALLVYSFMNEFAQKFFKTIKGIEPDVLKLLESQYWKGNVRELRNVMERAILMMDGDELRIKHFNFLIDEVKKKPKDDNLFS